MVGSGRLDNRIKFRTKGTTLDAYGEPNLEELTDFATVWAELMSISPFEKSLAGSDQALQMTRFRIRYRNDLHEDMAIDWNGYRYDIRGIEPSGNHNKEWLVVTANRNKKI